MSEPTVWWRHGDRWLIEVRGTAEDVQAWMEQKRPDWADLQRKAQAWVDAHE